MGNHSEPVMYNVLEYAEHGSLCNFIKYTGPLEEEVVRLYFLQILDAVNFMHSKEYAHLDLKPNNIMLDKDDHIKLIDFNLSKTGMATSLQRTKSFCGTYAYMPP